jgi:hypothetical protein
MNPPADESSAVNGGQTPVVQKAPAGGNGSNNGNGHSTGLSDAARRVRAGALSGAILFGLAAPSVFPTTSGPPASAASAFPASSPCPNEGDGGDTTLNVLKNRFVAPSPGDIVPTLTTPANMIALDKKISPDELKSHQGDWPNNSAASAAKSLENQAATIEGYLIDIKQEIEPPKNPGGQGGESCNCHRYKTLFDYHIYVADQPGVRKNQTVVVEMTPRWRSANPSWGTADNDYSGYDVISGLKNQRVRVTGWLLFDEDHKAQAKPGREWYRATVWELHPITTFEYQKDGVWTAL